MEKINFRPTFQRTDQNLRPISSISVNNEDESTVIDIPDGKLNLVLRHHRENEIVEGLIENCLNLDVACTILLSKKIREHFKKKKRVFVLYFHLNENFTEFEEEQLKKLNTVFKNKSVLLYFTKSDENFLIYWKSHGTPNEPQEFLKLEPYNKQFGREDKAICEFVVEFLKISLKKGHLGLSTDYSFKCNGKRIKLHLLASFQNYNLIMLASKVGNIDVVKILLKYCMNVAIVSQSITAQALAWQGNHQNVVLELVKANCTYPTSLKPDICSAELYEFMVIAEQLHEKIQKFSRIPKPKKEEGKESEKEQENEQEKIQKQETEQLHQEVKEILDKNKRLRYFYNYRNNSAVATALKCKSLEMYELLIANHLTFGPDENIDELCSGFNQKEKELMGRINAKYSIDVSGKHINILLENSSMASDEIGAAEGTKLILEAYKFLDANPNISILLRAVAASKIFKIIYDFREESANRIDPNTSYGTDGAFNSSGRIAIGAKQLLTEERKLEVYATIAHELCHYVMYLTFNNMCKPYREGDKKTSQDFEEISKICEHNRKEDWIIDVVYESYMQDLHHAELIVRPVHMMMFYDDDPDNLTDLTKTFQRLFDFYINTVVPAITDAMGDIENRLKNEREKLVNKLETKIKEQEEKIIEINEIVDQKNAELEEKDVEMKKRLIQIVKQRKYIIGIVIASIILAIGIGMAFYTPYYSFNELSQSKKDKVKNGLIDYKDVTVRYRDIFPNDSGGYAKLTSDDIRKLLNDKPVKFDEHLKDFVYLEWTSMRKELKEKFLSSKFQFQNEILSLEELHKIYSIAFPYLTSNQIVQVLDGETLNVGVRIENSTKFYVDRKFIPEIAVEIAKNYTMNNKKISFKDYYESSPKSKLHFQSETFDQSKKNDLKKAENLILLENSFKYIMKETSLHQTIDEVIDSTTKSEVFILSSEAGWGKTVVFEQIAQAIKKRFPFHWVSYVDLKSATRFYNHDEKFRETTKLLTDILGLDDEKEFEKKIFEESFKMGQVVFIWNDFDTIHPTYSKFVLKLMKHIHFFTKNLQYINTRTMCSDLLAKNLKVNPSILVPFTNFESENFLREFFKSENMSDEQIDTNVEDIQKELKKFSAVFLPSRNFDTPLMLLMIGSIFKDNKKPQSINIYNIYEQYLSKSEHGINKDNQRISTRSIRQLRQHFAMRSDFFSMITLLIPALKKLNILNNNYIHDVKTFQDLSAFGVIRVESKDVFEFEHRSFAEFYIATYFIDNIYSLIDDISEEEAQLRADLFFTILSYFDVFPRVFMFIESYIDSQEPKKMGIHEKLAKVIRNRYRNKLLYIFDGLEYDIEAYNFTLKFFKNDHKLLVDLLKVNEDETLFTAIANPFYHCEIDHRAIRYVTKMYLKEGDEIENFLDKSKITKILEIIRYERNSDYSDEKMNFWDFYETNEHLKNSPKRFVTSNAMVYIYIKYVDTDDDYIKFWSKIGDNASLDFFKNLIYFLFDAKIEFNRSEKLDKALMKANEKLTEVAKKSLAKNSKLLYKVASFYPEVEILWKFIEDNTSPDDRRELLSYDDSKNLEAFTSYYTEYDIEELMYTHTFHRVFFDHKSGDMKSCVKFGKNIYSALSNEDIRKIIVTSNIPLVRHAFENYKELSELIAGYFKEVFVDNKKQLNEYLNSKMVGTDEKFLKYLRDLNILNNDEDSSDVIKVFEDLNKWTEV